MNKIKIERTMREKETFEPGRWHLCEVYNETTIMKTHRVTTFLTQ